MQVGIIMPVVLQNKAMLSATLDAVARLRSTHSLTLYLVCNRLSCCGPEVLRAALRSRFAGTVDVIYEPFVERSVGGAWNEGCRHAVTDGSAYVALIANDVLLEPDCLDRMVAFGERCEAELWSGISTNGRTSIDGDASTDGADFSCAMLPPATLERFGLFDPNFRPAYFEDNDYYGRIVLGGGRCRVVHAARFFHHGSLTVRLDAEMAHHVAYWFEKNRRYFARKWGVSVPETSADGVLRHYYRHPFNDPSRPLWWFPDDAVALGLL
jgi:hypothetical protein